MYTQRGGITWIISGMASICLSGVAWANDAWPSDFDWELPQTVTEASTITCSWHFNATAGCYDNCSYRVSLYLSRDTSFSKAGDYLFYAEDDRVPAGAIGFDETATCSDCSTITSPGKWTLPRILGSAARQGDPVLSPEGPAPKYECIAAPQSQREFECKIADIACCTCIPGIR